MKTVYLIVLVSAIFLVHHKSSAQRYLVSGKVTESITEHPVIQLSVEEVNTKTGTITGQEGQYTLLLKEGDVKILFRGPGYKDAQFSFHLKGDTVIDVSLLPDLLDRSRRIKRETLSAKEMDGALKASLPQKN